MTHVLLFERARDTGKRPPDVEELIKKKFTVDFRQQDAIPKTEGKLSMGLWSFESPYFQQGRRRFVAANYLSFYKWYLKCDESVRHFYEIIQEDRPCRLYFDLEYKKEHNREVNSERMLHQFIDVCVRVIRDTMTFELDHDKNFLILDSSSESKFSAHIIVHFPKGRLFQSTVALKPLIDRICEQMKKENVGVIKGEDGSSKLFCDQSVYTRNRNFRLILSSKCNPNGTPPNPILKLAKSCQFYQGSTPPIDFQIFLDSLVSPALYERYGIMEIPSSLSDDQGSQPKRQLLARLYQRNIIALNTGKLGTLRFHKYTLLHFRKSTLFFLAPVQKENTIHVLASGCAPSPFPALDEFMLGVFQKLNPPASRIRKWETFLWKNLKKEERWERMINYYLENCRFCHNINREHKRQNVYWRVNLDCWVYTQRCFDFVDCPNFETEPVGLPVEIIESILKVIDRVIPDHDYPDFHRSKQIETRPLKRHMENPVLLFANILEEYRELDELNKRMRIVENSQSAKNSSVF